MVYAKIHCWAEAGMTSNGKETLNLSYSEPSDEPSLPKVGQAQV